MKNILHKYSKTTIPRGYRNESGMKRYIMLRKLRWGRYNREANKIKTFCDSKDVDILIVHSSNSRTNFYDLMEYLLYEWNNVDNVIYNQYDLIRKKALKQMKLWL